MLGYCPVIRLGLVASKSPLSFQDSVRSKNNLSAMWLHKFDKIPLVILAGISINGIKVDIKLPPFLGVNK